jgi:hypothetical protein
MVVGIGCQRRNKAYNLRCGYFDFHSHRFGKRYMAVKVFL